MYNTTVMQVSRCANQAVLFEYMASVIWQITAIVFLGSVLNFP